MLLHFSRNCYGSEDYRVPDGQTDGRRTDGGRTADGHCGSLRIVDPKNKIKVVAEKVVKSKKNQKYAKTAVFLPQKAGFCEIQKNGPVQI